MSPFVWNGQEHHVHLAETHEGYAGWFDETAGCGVMRDDGCWTFDELVQHWQSEMRSKN